MISLLKKLTFIPILLLLGTTAYGQQKAFSASVNLGLGRTLLSSGVSYYLGVNPTYDLFSILSLEGQLAYRHTRITGAFLTGDQSVANTGSALVGGRVYLTSPEKPLRVYFNLLVGPEYVRERELEDDTIRNEFRLGLSFGGFLTWQRMQAGLALGSPAIPTLKVGYVF